MRHLHLNNHISSKQSIDEFAKKVFQELMSGKDFTVSVDDGDGYVWKYTIIVDCSRIETLKQVTEN